MTPSAIILALLKVLPGLIKLANTIFTWAHDRKMVAEGELQAIATATQALNRSVAIATSAAQEAEAKHRKDSGDSAFDHARWRD